MNQLRFFYIWSPRYEIFHHILKSSFENSPYFNVQGIFVPQSVFDEQSYKENATHFLDGNSVKYRILLGILEKHPGETIILSDVDTIIENPTRLREYLESYLKYDIVYAKSSEKNSKELSAGFGMIRSSSTTISFIQKIIHKINETGKDDMTILNQEISSFTGSYSQFTFPEISQTQYYSTHKGNYYVMQITCSNHSNRDMNLFEKLVSTASLMDISVLIPLIPENVLEAMVDFYKVHHPDHYLLSLVAPIS